MKHTTLSRNALAAACLSITGLVATAGAQTITSIGSLQPVGGTVEGLAISADGSAVTGYSTLSGGSYRAVRWTAAGGLQNLGTVPNGLRSLAFAISGDGSVVTGMSVLSGTGHVFRWTAAGGMVDLGTLPAQNVSYGYAISGDGQVIAGGPSSTGLGHAFTWTAAGGMTDLGVLPGAPADASSALYGMDMHGSYGVGYCGTVDGDRAILWSNERSTMENLGVFPGGTFSEADAISSDGMTVTGTSDSAAGQSAFLWTRAGGMIDLGNVSGRTGSDGAAISADGSVVVGYDNAGAILWTNSLGMVDLQSYLAAHGVNMTGWTLIACYGISADGTAMTGTGHYSGGTRAWVVRGLPPFTCAADFDGNGVREVPDIFAFLSAWFAFDPRADFDHVGGIAVPDIFAFLSAWFAGCP